jgi:hypothetical protein
MKNLKEHVWVFDFMYLTSWIHLHVSSLSSKQISSNSSSLFKA